ncbi:hypothetical protein EON67_08120 [archaeon]|nr:MAG: hypothetical protein EON67_08120 [archaeon]
MCVFAVDTAIASIMAAYRANVSTALLSRGQEEVYAVQYVEDKSATPVTAALTVRYIGKPVYEMTDRNTVRGFQYASALPAYLSRLVGQGRVALGTSQPYARVRAPLRFHNTRPACTYTDPVPMGCAHVYARVRGACGAAAGDETTDEVEEEIIADNIDNEYAARRATARLPIMARNLMRTGELDLGPVLSIFYDRRHVLASNMSATLPASAGGKVSYAAGTGEQLLSMQ